jgi:hypothetical protein
MMYVLSLVEVMVLLAVVIYVLTAIADLVLSGRRKKGRARDDG